MRRELAQPVIDLKRYYTELLQKKADWTRGTRWHRYSPYIGILILYGGWFASFIIVPLYQGQAALAFLVLVSLLVGSPIAGVLIARILPSLDKQPFPPSVARQEKLFLRIYPAYENLSKYVEKKSPMFRSEAASKLARGLDFQWPWSLYIRFATPNLLEHLVSPTLEELEERLWKLPKVIRSTDEVEDILLSFRQVLDYLIARDVGSLEKALEGLRSLTPPPKVSPRLLWLRPVLWPHLTAASAIIFLLWLFSFYVNTTYFGTDPSEAYGIMLTLIVLSFSGYAAAWGLAGRKRVAS